MKSISSSLTLLSFSVYLRYTSSRDNQSIYACLLQWPNTTAEVLLGAPISSSNTTVTLLSSSIGLLKWRPASASGGIVIDVSNIDIYSLSSDWAWVFKLTHVSGIKKAHENYEKNEHDK